MIFFTFQSQLLNFKFEHMEMSKQLYMQFKVTGMCSMGYAGLRLGENRSKYYFRVPKIVIFNDFFYLSVKI